MDELEKNVRQFLEYLEVEKGHSDLTVENYQHYLKRFTEWGRENGVKSPSDINLAKIHQFRLWLNRLVNKNVKALNPSRLPRIKKNTQNYHLIALRSFLKYLAKNDIHSLVPEKIELADTDDRVVSFLEPDELARLFQEPDINNITGLRNRTILEILFSTGLRVSELVNLDRDDINLDTKEFNVVGKGGKSRVVFLSDSARDWLKKYLSKRDNMDKAVFIRQVQSSKFKVQSENLKLKRVNNRTKDNKSSLRLTPRTIQRILNKHSKEAGITKKVTPHSLRHTFGTDLLMAGADIRAVQQLLGHSSITTTQIYTHVTDQHLHDVHQKFHSKKNNL